jgi:hypothetical protein
VKKITCFKVGATLLLFFIFSGIAFSHPPAKIEITYEPATKTVTAVIVHPVNNPAGHFISKVDISLNGKEIIEHVISRQDNADSQTVRYLIPDITAGDTIGVEGYCNVNGTLTSTVTAQ